MSKRYPYPRDEFDNVDQTNRPKEVHAARRSTWSKVWPFIVVIVVVPLIAFGVVKYLSSWNDANVGGDEDSEAPPTLVQTMTDAPATPDPAGSAEGADEATPASTEVANTLKPPDRALAVVILNAKGEQGLAAKAMTLLEVDWWTNVSVADYDGQATDGLSAVYYAKNAQKASAQVVAGILQIDEIKKDKAQTNNGAITAVLRADYIIPDVID